MNVSSAVLKKLERLLELDKKIILEENKKQLAIEELDRLADAGYRHRRRWWDLPSGTYETAAGSTVVISADHAGISDVIFDWAEEPDACCDCEVEAYPEGNRLVWNCSECGGGSAELRAREARPDRPKTVCAECAFAVVDLPELRSHAIWTCGASEARKPERVNPVTGEKSFHDEGHPHLSKNPRPHCRDINLGQCEFFEKGNPQRYQAGHRSRYAEALEAYRRGTQETERLGGISVVIPRESVGNPKSRLRRWWKKTVNACTRKQRS